MKIIKNNVSSHFDVIENFTQFDQFQIPHKAAYRFLMGREFFPEFEYIYFSDIDFIVLNQQGDNFYEFYIDWCQKTSLPFSNSWNYDMGRFRACGLHFVIKTPYFDVMDKWINIMKGQNTFRKEYTFNEKDPTLDEEMLYYMLVHEFDLRSLQSIGRKFPGIHLRDYREECFAKMKADKKNHVENKATTPPAIYERDELRLRRADPVVKTEIFNELYLNTTGKAKTYLDNFF